MHIIDPHHLKTTHEQRAKEQGGERGEGEGEGGAHSVLQSLRKVTLNSAYKEMSAYKLSDHQASVYISSFCNIKLIQCTCN